MTDNVNSPAHYTKVYEECIDTIKAAKSNLTENQAVLVEKIINHIWLFANGGGLFELQQARQDLEFLLSDVYYSDIIANVKELSEWVEKYEAQRNA
jgi:beta-lactamase regulating signal transducer with metallopeptidase domain